MDSYLSSSRNKSIKNESQLLIKIPPDHLFKILKIWNYFESFLINQGIQAL